MKRINQNIIAVFALLLSLVMAPLFQVAATDYKNQSTDKREYFGKTQYYGSVTISDTVTSAAYYTKPFYIGTFTDNYGWVTASCTDVTTEDLNVFIEYSNDKANWTAGTTDSDLDSVTTAFRADTVGIVQGTASIKYKAHLWARLKIVPGQTISSTVFNYTATFDKPKEMLKEWLGLVSSSTD